MNQTAVEWLIEQIKNEQNQKALSANEWMKIINDAIQMEQEQMINIIRFFRTHNKMGKSVDDLFYEYYNANHSVDSNEMTQDSICPDCKSYDFSYHLSIDKMKCNDCGQTY